MAKSSSQLWGSDYVGASFEEIYKHLEGYRKSTSKLINKLKKYRSETTKCKSKLDDYDDTILFVDVSIETYSCYLSEFDRLLLEIKEGVTETHIVMLEALIQSSRRFKDSIVNFKTENFAKTLSDESMRPLLSNIYVDTRNENINYTDLYSVRTRLKTFIGVSLKKNGLKLSNKEESIEKPKRGRQQFTFKSKVMKVAKTLRSKNPDMSITDMVYRHEIITAINPIKKAFNKEQRPSDSEYQRTLGIARRTIYNYISEALNN